MEDKAMKSIIDELYNQELFRSFKITSEEYKATLNHLVKLEAEILSTYPDIKELLDDYQSAESELTRLSNRSEFRLGVKLGAQLVLEMMKPLK